MGYFKNPDSKTKTEKIKAKKKEPLIKRFSKIFSKKASKEKLQPISSDEPHDPPVDKVESSPSTSDIADKVPGNKQWNEDDANMKERLTRPPEDKDPPMEVETPLQGVVIEEVEEVYEVPKKKKKKKKFVLCCFGKHQSFAVVCFLLLFVCCLLLFAVVSIFLLELTFVQCCSLFNIVHCSSGCTSSPFQ